MCFAVASPVRSVHTQYMGSQNKANATVLSLLSSEMTEQFPALGLIASELTISDVIPTGSYSLVEFECDSDLVWRG